MEIKTLVATGKGLEYFWVLVPKIKSEILGLKEGTEMVMALEGDRIVSKRLGGTKVIEVGSQIKKLIQMKYSLYMPIPKGYADALGINKGDKISIDVEGNKLIVKKVNNTQ